MAYLKTWSECQRDSRLIYMNKDRFAYLYGANGEVLDTYDKAYRLCKTLWETYPSHFSNYVTKKGYRFEDLVEHVKGKKVFDCSSYVCAVTQFRGDIFDFQPVWDYNSYTLRNKFSKVTSIPSGLIGQVLWREGHVGFDTGNGIIQDFAAEFVDCRQYRFDSETGKAMNFTVSGQLPWVDYSGGISR